VKKPYVDSQLCKEICSPLIGGKHVSVMCICVYLYFRKLYALGVHLSIFPTPVRQGNAGLFLKHISTTRQFKGLHIQPLKASQYNAKES